jgi:LPXTG-motif cell wall-anchored protein
MTRKRRALVGIVVVSSLSFMASPAAAADGLLFSADGEIWRAAFSEPLFAGAVLVPGAHVSRSFRIRNGSEHGAELSISIRGREFSAAAAPESLWITAAVAGQEQAAEPGLGAHDRVVLAMPEMVAGQGQKITVTVGLGGDARNVMQEQLAPVQFDVVLTESVPSMDSGREVPPTEAGTRLEQAVESPLANTGFAGTWLATLGTSLIVGGGLAVIRNRRRTSTNGGVSNGTA